MIRLPWLLVMLALAPSAVLGDESIRCAGGIVSLGDSKLDLLGKCGEPAYRESRVEERGVLSRDDRPRAGASELTAVAVERWTYDLGLNRFAGIVTMTMGRITAAEHGNRGRLPVRPEPVPSVIPRARCDYLGLDEGDLAGEVLSRCGEPALRERGERTQTISTAVDDGRRGDGGKGGVRREVLASTTVAVERWSYDFGPNVLVRHLDLLDGVVVSVTTGGRGYSEP